MIKLSWPNKVTHLSQPDIRPYSKGKYILAQGWMFRVDDGPYRTYRIIIPDGFILDGASVGRPFWTIAGLRPDGLIRAAALAHDWCYRHKGKILCAWGDLTDQGVVQFSREEADTLFLDLMLAADMERWRSKMAYSFVRVFGTRW